MNKTVRNPAIGHRITFLQTAVQTNGELLQIMYVVENPESKPAIPHHIHLLGGIGRLLGYKESYPR